MNTKHQPYITLDSIITDYLNESEQSNNKYFKIFHIAFRGMDSLGIDFFYRLRCVKLPVNANLTVNLPEDFLNWTKIGVLNDRGEIIPLYYNDKLTSYADISSDRLEKTQDDTISEDWNEFGLNTWSNYWNGSGYVSVYGVPSGAPFVGSFKIDMDNGLIVLNESYDYDYLMVEYVATPKEGQEYYLPIQFREAMLAWVWWKDKKASSIAKGRVGIPRELERAYYNEKRNAIARYKPVRKQQIYQASKEMTRLAIKS